MSVLKEPEVNWDPSKMVEVTLNEPDDFLKVRETHLPVLVSHQGKKRKYINLVIFFISKVGIF